MYHDASCMPRVRKQTLRVEFVCPSKVLTHVKSATAQSFKVPSPEAVATHYNESREREREREIKFAILVYRYKIKI